MNSLLKVKNIQWLNITLIIGLIFSALILRFWQISSIPVAFYHDEMDYVFSGETVARWGTDITGQWSPWQLKPLQTLNITAELPAVFQAFFQSLFGFGPQSGHLVSAFFGLATTLALATLALHLTHHKKIALFTGLALALNPWHIYISRMGYEAVISLFFQISLVLLFWKTTQIYQQTHQTKTHQKLLLIGGVILSLALAYFTYHGAKITAPAITLLMLVWMWFQKTPTRWNRWKVIITTTLLVTLAVLATHFYLTQNSGLYGSRDSELLFSNDYLSAIVNTQRRQSLLIPAQSLIINKPTVLLQELIKRYASVFDLNRFFINGYESGFQFSLMVHGFFYLTSLPLIFLGAAQLWKKYKPAATFIFPILVVSPIASSITIGYQSLFRSALTYTLLCFLTGVGIAFILEWLSKKPFKNITRSLFLAVLLAQAAWFGIRYFTLYPILSADNHYLSEKLMANYARYQTNPVTIVTEKQTYSKARSFLAYNQLSKSLTPEERKQFTDITNKQYVFGENIITENCPVLDSSHKNPIIVEAGAWQKCNFPQFLATASAQLNQDQITIKSLSSPIDSGSYFYLINDTSCDENNLNTFISIDSFHDLKIENLTQAEFCQTWVKKEKL